MWLELRLVGIDRSIVDTLTTVTQKDDRQTNQAESRSTLGYM